MKPMSRSAVLHGLWMSLAAATGGCASGAPAPDASSPVSVPASLPAPVPLEVPFSAESPEAWFRAGALTAQARGAGSTHARNLILFIGDGMSLPTVAAARILAGQQAGGPDENHQLSFERFGYTALSKTYNTDHQTPDSAGTGTAMASGVKTRMGVLGVDQTAERGNCASAKDAAVPTLIEIAESAGLATGIVTTTRITHATPASMYAHTPDRDWESDAELTPEAVAQGCRDIATQLIEFDAGDGPEVVLGGGREMFLPQQTPDPEYPQQHGERSDGRNLIATWQQKHPDGRYVWNAEQLAAVDASTPGPVMGLFQPSHMQFEQDRAHDAGGEPSLEDMTRFAITRLQAASPQGFVLLVEAGRIDHAHHGGNAYRALTDTIELSDAVQAAAELTSTDDTLIIVTADHSHTLSFVGYPGRGNPILGLVAESADAHGERELALDDTGLPYTTLSYANGPGYVGASDAQPEGPKTAPHFPKHYEAAKNGRPDLREVDTQDPSYLQEALVPRNSESHGGDDVGIYASGPGSASVRGVLEQNVIFHVLAQSQADIVRWLCQQGDCDDSGQPTKLPRP